MNHLGDTNKMVDTPRTDARRGFHGWYTAVDAEFSEQLERELNAANERIKRLEEMYEGVIGERPELLGSNVMGLLKRELNTAQRRIKRLEEAVDAYRKAYTPDGHVSPHDCFATGPKTGNPIEDLIACPGCLAERKAKEAKP